MAHVHKVSTAFHEYKAHKQIGFPPYLFSFLIWFSHLNPFSEKVDNGP